MPAQATAFDPFDDAIVAGDLITPILPKNLKPSKSEWLPLHCRRRLTAEKAFDRLVMSLEDRDLPQSKPDVPRLSVNVKDMKIESLLSSNLGSQPKTEQDGPWDGRRLVRKRSAACPAEPATCACSASRFARTPVSG